MTYLDEQAARERIAEATCRAVAPDLVDGLAWSARRHELLAAALRATPAPRPWWRRIAISPNRLRSTR